MRLSTMTNLFYEDREDQKNFLNSVRRTAAVGFKVMDFCMCPFQRHETELLGDDWEAKTYEIANEAARLGVEFSQSHLPYPKPLTRRKTAADEGCEKNEFFMWATERAIRVSGILGVKWAIVHPVQKSADVDTERDVAYNHVIYDKYLTLASSLGVGLAFENMADVDNKRRFAATAPDLCAIVDSYNSEYVGACWDFGHGNRVFADQCAQVRMLGDRLKATHVDDNVGKDDLHIIPFMGTAKWPEIMKTLREINYGGDFNFELASCKRMPPELKQATVEYIYKVGQYLMSL
ncbi:MAG: sugar phosphate isomerase/epimerase [Clostridia bacterium]|nr:sugar phosphate isomerase/epimerase [Clostridia bacterium]